MKAKRKDKTEAEKRKKKKLEKKSHLGPAPALDRAHVLVDELVAILEVVDPGLLVALLELLAEELLLS